MLAFLMPDKKNSKMILYLGMIAYLCPSTLPKSFYPDEILQSKGALKKSKSINAYNKHKINKL
jgi:hypothetical protein